MSWSAGTCPARAKRHIAEHDDQLLHHATPPRSLRELGLGNRTNTVLQAAFFKLANIIPIDDAVKYMKAAIETSYGAKKGQNDGRHEQGRRGRRSDRSGQAGHPR